MRLALLTSLLLALGPGCAHWSLLASTERTTPAGEAPARLDDNTPVELWMGSAPPGIVVEDNVARVDPAYADQLEIVGKTRVRVELDPPPYVACPVVGCATLLCLPAPFAFGYWLAYALFPSMSPADAERNAELKDALLQKLRAEARAFGATAVILVDTTVGDDGVVARGLLLRRTRAPSTTKPAP